MSACNRAKIQIQLPITTSKTAQDMRKATKQYQKPFNMQSDKTHLIQCKNLFTLKLNYLPIISISSNHSKYQCFTIRMVTWMITTQNPCKHQPDLNIH